jgi:hypothetical protein
MSGMTLAQPFPEENEADPKQPIITKDLFFYLAVISLTQTGWRHVARWQ